MKSIFFIAALLGSATFANAETDPVDSLIVSQNVSLDEVVVSATKVNKATPVAYSDLSKQELKQRNDGQGIPYLISLSPSVIMTSDAGNGVGYSGFRVRGTDASRINITLNGVPVNEAESHTVFWVNMPDIASSVENLQIQRGVGTSMNGGAAFGATVAMQTENPSQKPYMEYSVSAGSFGTVRNTIKGGTGLLKDHFVFDARYSKVRSDGFISRASADMSSYFVSGAYYGDNTLIKFQTFGSAEKTYQAWNGVPSSMLETNRTYNPCGEYVDENDVTQYYNNQTDNYWQHHYHLMGTQRLNDHWTMNLTLHYTDGNGYYEDYKAGAKYKSYKLPVYTNPAGEEVAKTDLVRRKWLDNDFYGAIYNANYRAENLTFTFGAAANRYDGDHFGRVIWARAANALPKPDYEYYLNRGLKTDYNTFVKLNYQFLPVLTGFLDLQYRGIDYSIKGSDDKAGDNVNVSKHWDFFNPKVGLNFNKGGHAAFASFSVANREPSRDNFTEAGENEQPVHETLYDYEAGYTYHHPQFNVGVNLYYMDYNNQLILSGKISEIGEALTTNIKDSYRAGIELIGGVKLASWLNWSGNATFSRNKVRNFTEFVDDWDTGEQRSKYLGTTNISFSPDVIANSIFDLSYKGFSASFISQYVGRQYMDNSSSKDRSIDDYFINSLRLGYTFKPRFVKEISLDVTVNNLFNEKYETNGWVYSYYSGGERGKQDGYFTQAGTNAMARVSLRF
ncbi:TonB-dependent receptor plug domain-containing protein [Massilibacteroides sp.]|uniref:TonB-dependent receptor n=1 Tax=Massilibacteroides sp. TaxID=2034766 RepID=UPI0026187C31|nr:TonB-dependent receptor plug domain-containing protein [Massilibacteroides sp.]MDD4513956.1 TonB-dependent receptor [Massilibacteroides sp.]